MTTTNRLALGRSLARISLALVLTAFLCFTAAVQPEQAAAESKTITGKIVSLDFGLPNPFGNRRVTMVIKSGGKDYTVYCGQKTTYMPHRQPQVGDRVSVEVIPHQGAWAGLLVKYNPS